MGELLPLLAIDEEFHSVHAVKLRQCLHDGGHHVAFGSGVRKAQNLLAQINTGKSFGNIQIKGGILRQHGAQTQPGGVHVVLRGLHHHLQRCLGDAVLIGHIAHHRHQIAVVILIVHHGGHGLLRFTGGSVHSHLRAGGGRGRGLRGRRRLDLRSGLPAAPKRPYAGQRHGNDQQDQRQQIQISLA